MYVATAAPQGPEAKHGNMTTAIPMTGLHRRPRLICFLVKGGNAEPVQRGVLDDISTSMLWNPRRAFHTMHNAAGRVYRNE